MEIARVQKANKKEIMIKKIITHSGQAHVDDFLSCCVLAYVNEFEGTIWRREPTVEEIYDPEVAVIDIGGIHNPAKLNFDHHHFSEDQEPTCSLSLVLDHIGIYQNALKHLPWLHTVEWFDSRGPTKTAEYLKINTAVIKSLSNPISQAVMSWFSECGYVDLANHSQDLMSNLMYWLGEEILYYANSASVNN